MKVKPNKAYRHANYPTNTALDPSKVYDAEIAYNLPNWREQGKIFIECPNGAPAISLQMDEYTIASGAACEMQVKLDMIKDILSDPASSAITMIGEICETITGVDKQ